MIDKQHGDAEITLSFLELQQRELIRDIEGLEQHRFEVKQRSEDVQIYIDAVGKHLADYEYQRRAQSIGREDAEGLAAAAERLNQIIAAYEEWRLETAKAAA